MLRLKKLKHMKTLILTLTVCAFCVNICCAQFSIGLLNNHPKTIVLQSAANESTAAGAPKMLAAGGNSQIPGGTRLKIINRSVGLVEVADMSGNTYYIAATELYNKKRVVNITAIGGAVTFPFKIRPQTGVIEPSFSLSGVAGLHFSLDKDTVKSLSILIGVGPSSIILNNRNSTDTGSSTRAAATFSITLLGQWDNIQLAFSIGWDNNLDNGEDKWKYQSKPWLSLGVGFNIFSNKSN